MRKSIVLVSALLASFAMEASAGCRLAIAKVASTQGQVHVQGYGTGGWQSIQKDYSLCPGDTLRTSKWSRATLSLSSGSLLTVDQNTTMTFSEPKEVASSWVINLLKGTTFFRSRQPQHLEIKTPFINAIHEGTEFLVAVSDQQSEISAFDGQVSGVNKAGKVTINKGFKGIAQANRPPQVQALNITPEDAVQWALNYPAIIDDTKLKSGLDSPLNPALAAYRQGDSTLALDKLDEISLGQQDVHYLTLKAAMLLTVGRLDEAQPFIQQAQRLEPNNSDAFALQAVVAVTKNQQQAALDYAIKAVAANPKSSVAKIAQSYAYQAQFNLDEALIATHAATRLSPDNALAWARLSELQLSQGDHDDALDSAKKAQALNPKLAKTETILGFANLAHTEIDEAKRSFEQALVLDSSDPLARLGLGLAKIRKGDVESGKSELETAVNLDPNNAVIRSYLGKAYYELRNKDYAGKEFEIAKEMDSKDPTPYFYDAILKQTTNRPVEALHDMQKAIELNGNRQVYRSNLLLDKDLAARGAALGRIYNELGFAQRGLVEGWRAVTQDPTDYTSHRLLSDTYSALPRHDLARSSELLQSQLLQPINVTPVQPRLAESQLFLVGGLGPSALSLNEFNPLFERNRFSLLTSGLVGSNDTYSDEVVHSGLWDDFSYSLGQFHYQTEGFRKNNDIDANIYNAFAQARITPDLGIQAEYRHREVDRGNLESYFAPQPFDQIFFDKFRLQSAADTYRFGTHWSPTSQSDVLGSYIHIDKAETVSFNSDSSTFKYHADIGEAQYIQRFDTIKTIFGGGYYHLDTSEAIVQNSNGYLYTHVRYPATVNWTLGLSLSHLDDAIYPKDLQSINPKFGLLWDITPSTVFRVAAFRNVNTSRLPYQTLEPVQIAGFNQFFDDIYRTEAIRWGVGLDHKFGSTLSGGAEISRRYLKHHILDQDNAREILTDRRESNYRAYLLWAPHPRWAGTLEYFREHFDNSENGGALDTETQVIPVGLSYFDPSGLFAKFKTSFYRQTVNVNNQDQSDNTVFLDLSLGYRLPKRYGLFEVQFQNLLDQNYRYEGLQARQPVDNGGVPPFLPFPPRIYRFCPGYPGALRGVKPVVPFF
jgi:Flp pilus assembly protein TadD